ncbi:hypothetical protein CDAR_537981 [Caerostris darwini]|uniref:Uncharacterized protein n=1 Tax=Caerostris darwini TaxID=1538125 RepID=A0AAV4R560_9ARAC|nr:hypothetical protein CDAR_537981 [Caerostris darwini]
MQKSEGVEKENYTSVYSKKRATYKKEILHTKRQAWRKFCSESGTPFGKPFKTPVKISLPHLKSLKPLIYQEVGITKKLPRNYWKKSILSVPKNLLFVFLKLTLLLKIRHLLKKKLKE